MKTIWNVIVTLALANMLAIVGLIAWLIFTQRLDVERANEIRDTLAETIPEEADRLKAEKVKLKEEQRIQEEEERLKGDPLTAATKIQIALAQDETQNQYIQRRQREINDLRETLLRDQRRLEDGWAELNRKIKEHEKYLEELEDTTGTEQFQKTMQTIQGQKPEDAKKVLMAMLDEGKVDEVISYIDAMDDRPRKKIVAEFVEDDSALAADLLSRLRTRGLAPASDPEETNG